MVRRLVEWVEQNPTAFIGFLVAVFFASMFYGVTLVSDRETAMYNHCMREHRSIATSVGDLRDLHEYCKATIRYRRLR